MDMIEEFQTLLALFVLDLVVKEEIIASNAFCTISSISHIVLKRTVLSWGCTAASYLRDKVLPSPSQVHESCLKAAR